MTNPITSYDDSFGRSMKFIFLLLIALFCGHACAEEIQAGADLSLPAGVEILWSVSNRWPSTVWRYKVTPRTFAAPVVSNLMTLARFTAANLTNIEDQSAFEDKRMLYFSNTERTRRLGIFGPLGWINYTDEAARAKGTQRAQGVPDDAQALELSLGWLKQLGIDRSQLATKEDTCELKVF